MLGERSDRKVGSSQSLVSTVMFNYEENAFMKMVANSSLIGVKKEEE